MKSSSASTDVSSAHENEESVSSTAETRENCESVESTQCHYKHPVAEPLVAQTPEEAKLSKNQLKRLRRQQHWEDGREARKLKRKAKNKEKKARKRLALTEGGTTTPDGSEAQWSGSGNAQGAWRRLHTLVPVTLMIDCAFDDLMLPKEIISLASQITRAYSDNSKSRYQSTLVVSSFNGKLKERFDTILRASYKQWKGIRFVEEEFDMVAAKHAPEWMKEAEEEELQRRKPDDEATSTPFSTSSEPRASDVADDAFLHEPGHTVYLTSDSPYTLERMMPHTTYVIGGLVDRNRHKGICYDRAKERGIFTAKLPIGEYMKMQSRFVLATNHVVEIMLRWLEKEDWGEVFLDVIPKRKGALLLSTTQQEEDNSETDTQ